MPFFDMVSATAPNLTQTAQGYATDSANWVNELINAALPTVVNLGKALLVFIAFWIIASIVSWLVAKAIDATGLAKRANNSADIKSNSLGKSLAQAVKWVIILIGLIQALAVAGATAVSEQLDQIVSPIMEYGDNLLFAILTFAIFMIVATVVKTALKNILVLADGLPQRFNLTEGTTNISGILSYLAYGFLILAGIGASLTALGVETISRPVNDLIADIVELIPLIAVAAIILAVFVFIGRLVSNLIERTLPGMGINEAVAELGVLKGADSGLTATSILSKVAMFLIVLLGLTAALRVLDIATLNSAMEVVLSMATQIIFGAFIIAAGVFIARLVSSAMASTGSGATDVAANVVKWVIIVLSVILGISRMGLDPTGGEFILNVAEYLIMGTAAAGALAFGWGGRDWAAKQLEKIRPSK